MPITVYTDVILPPIVVARGLAGQTEFNNTASVNQGGYQSININWPVPLRQYEIGYVPMLPAQWKTIQALHLITKGGAYGFLMLDPVDQTVDITEGKMSGTAGSVGPYILLKRYTSIGSTRTEDRIIKRPVATGLLCYVDGVSQAYTLNATTGTITFTVAPTVGQTLSWAGSFHVPVHFQQASLPWDLVREGKFNERLIMGQNVTLMEVRE